MTRLSVISLLMLLATSLFAITGHAQVTSVQEIKTPPLRKFETVQPKRIALANGMVIFLQEDHELPLIKGRATIRGGSRDVPAEKAGLLGIYGQAWRTGGTASQTGDQLDELLDARAARVETGGGVDSTTVALDVLKGDFDTVFPIWVELLRKPQFRQEKIDLAKTQANTGISRRNDDPGSIVGRESQKLGYGASSPYAAAGVRNHRLDHARRSARLPSPHRASEQHHPGLHRRLRFREDREAPARCVCLVAARSAHRQAAQRDERRQAGRVLRPEG
jgi:zinc protease